MKPTYDEPTPAPAQEWRETDAQIARLIMGWQWATLNPVIYTVLTGKRFLRPPNDVSASYVPCGESLPLDERYFDAVPHYSTDRGAALDVVDRLQESGLYVVINTTCDKGLYDVDVMDGVHFMSRGCVVFEPFAKGICLAALKAVESFADRAATQEQP